MADDDDLELEANEDNDSEDGLQLEENEGGDSEDGLQLEENEGDDSERQGTGAGIHRRTRAGQRNDGRGHGDPG